MDTSFKKFSKIRLISLGLFSVFVIGGVIYFRDLFPFKYKNVALDETTQQATPQLDIVAYNIKLKTLANIPPPKPVTKAVVKKSSAKTVTIKEEKKPEVTTTPIVVSTPLWPVTGIYPNAGAILPFKRVLAYYGNFYSKNMGILGEYPPEEVLKRLADEQKKWELADPATPIMPAIDYVAVTAQGYPGTDKLYVARMPQSQIDKALDMANKANGILFLDVQVGLSTLEKELPLLEKYLKLPQVHLAIDPEFSMKGGQKPGTVIGTFDAADINYAATYLAALVKANNLPPKILVIHRFTGPMVTNYKAIKPLPEVEMVIDMDGWGSPEHKTKTYNQVIYKEPVQFTGFKVFYKNDVREPKSILMTPEKILKLAPQPSYIQYQ